MQPSVDSRGSLQRDTPAGSSRRLRRWTSLALALSLGLVVTTSLEAQRRHLRDGHGWALLGRRTVTDRIDHDRIAVTRVRGDFRALRIKVFDRAVQFREVEVHYASGAPEKLELRSVIRPGGESRVIDLKGIDRVIRYIDLTYDAQSLGGKAKVEVWGLH